MESSPPPPEPLESELERLLDAPDSFWPGITRLCEKHPDLGKEIRELGEAIHATRSGTERSRANHDVDPRHGSGDIRPGDRIGRFVVLAEIGHGGMGSVYLAEQREPVERRVALKVIKLGMDTRGVLARFEAERQALARMEHPHIAKIFEAGATATGRPYFAMEHVKGVPITRYCDENGLSLDERLRLFLQVCSGVQHAHHKGVIHRDLTPNNVLVTLQDDKPAARIIDFGLARATDHRLTAKTIFTERGVILGTPEYMSPEQAGLGELDVDVRSDVYTLGVLLYELLTSRLPFDAKDLRAGGYEAMCRMIRGSDPPRPSTRVTTVPGGPARVAKSRRTDPGTLLRRLRSDLDWIVMRCLERDRTRRYATPNEIAADVQRHLDHEPVLAHAPSAIYRVRKALRRHRVASLMLAAVLLTAIGGQIVAYRDASAARDHAWLQVDNLHKKIALGLHRHPQASLESGAAQRLVDSYREFSAPGQLQDPLRWLSLLIASARDEILVEQEKTLYRMFTRRFGDGAANAWSWTEGEPDLARQRRLNELALRILTAQGPEQVFDRVGK